MTGGSGARVLAGMTVAVKDNLAVAGQRMTCGSRILQSFTPASDATVVSSFSIKAASYDTRELLKAVAS